MSKLTLISIAIAGCATAPRYPDSQRTIEQDSAATLGEMRATDPALEAVLHGGYAYAVFPDVGKSGRGVLYQARPGDRDRGPQAATGRELRGALSS